MNRIMTRLLVVTSNYLIISTRSYTFLLHSQRISIKANNYQKFRKISNNKYASTSKDDVTIVGDTVGFRNTQKKVYIDKDDIIRQTVMIKDILNVPEFHVDIWFCTEARIRELNEEHRNVRRSTDILSFPANSFIKPEEFEDDPAMEFDKHLGDLVIAPAYVLKRCVEDKLLSSSRERLDESEDRGVSKEMATIFDVKERFPLLIIHGMLHLLGYDHETDADWNDMTAKEVIVLQKLRQALMLKKMTML